MFHSTKIIMENAQLVNVAEVQLSFKSKSKTQDRLKVNSSREAYEILKRYLERRQHRIICETFKLLLLNRANKVLGVLTIISGWSFRYNGRDPKIIFAAAPNIARPGLL